MSMREEVLNSLTPYLNLTKFEVSNNYELSEMIENYKTNKIFEGVLRLNRTKGKRLKKRYIPSPRREQTVDPAVLYMNLGNKNNAAQYDCPTASDSSAVSLAQMAFLSMTVSIFTVIATIANNINNNNNNNNNNNLNLVKQKTQSISQNQNVVNQINIDLPPPVPGRKKRSLDSLGKLYITEFQLICQSKMKIKLVTQNDLQIFFSRIEAKKKARVCYRFFQVWTFK